jgi:hypothetical protein
LFADPFNSFVGHFYLSAKPFDWFVKPFYLFARNFISFAKPFNLFACILDRYNKPFAAPYESENQFASQYVFIANNFPAECSYTACQHVENSAHEWRKEQSACSADNSVQSDKFRDAM